MQNGKNVKTNDFKFYLDEALNVYKDSSSLLRTIISEKEGSSLENIKKFFDQLQTCLNNICNCYIIRNGYDRCFIDKDGKYKIVLLSKDFVGFNINILKYFEIFDFNEDSFLKSSHDIFEYDLVVRKLLIKTNNIYSVNSEKYQKNFGI